MKRDIQYLKEKFESGDTPMAEDFQDLIDSFLHKDDDAGSVTISIASRQQAEYATNNTVMMTPLRVAQAISVLVRLNYLPNLKEDIRTLIEDVMSFSFSISSVDIIQIENKLKATINVTNASNISLEYSIDDVSYQTSNIFTNLSSTNYFYVRSVTNTSQKRRIEKIKTVNSTVVANKVPQIAIVAPTHLNEIDLSFLGEFDMPVNAITGKPVIENLFKGPNFRQQGHGTNPFKMGYTHIEWGMCKTGTEKQDYPYHAGFLGSIPIERISFYGSNSYPNMGLDVNSSAADILNVPYSKYEDLENDYKYNVPQIFKTNDTVFKGNLVAIDIENGIHDLPAQEYINRLVALNDALLRGTGDNTDISFIYQTLPIPDVAFSVTRELYSRISADYSWSGVAVMTQNASEKGMPQRLVGKSVATLSNRIRASFEFYFRLEFFLPEGYILKSILDQPLKDYAGNDISVLSHFDTTKPSYFHWAAHIAGALGVQHQFLGEHNIEFRTNNFNIGGTGYYYQYYDSGQPDSTKLKQCFDRIGKYKVPNFIVEGAALLAIFCKAKYTNWEGGITLQAVDRAQGVTIEEYPLVSRRDYEGTGAQNAALKRLAVALEAQNYVVTDLIDGNEIYTLHNTKVDYLNISNFSGVRAVNPLDWIQFKCSPIHCIVNEQKGLIAIYACQAYGVEQSEADVYYTENGFNFKKRIQIGINKNEIYIFSLTENEGATPVTPSPNEIFITFFGESGAAGRSNNSDATTAELGVHTSVQIVNNTNLTIQDLNISSSGNNDLDDYDSVSNTHGWELGLAKAVEAHIFTGVSKVYLAKTGQGRALTGQFNVDANPQPNYWQKFIARTNIVKNYFSTNNKTYKTYVVYSQGINNIVLGTSAAQWKTETLAIMARIRAQLGANTVIIMTKFGATFNNYNSVIDEIVASNNNLNKSIDTANLTLQDAYHWDYASNKSIINSAITIIRNNS